MFLPGRVSLSEVRSREYLDDVDSEPLECKLCERRGLCLLCLLLCPLSLEKQQRCWRSSWDSVNICWMKSSKVYFFPFSDTQLP